MPESATRSSTVQTASQQVRAFIAKSPNSKVVKFPIPQMFVSVGAGFIFWQEKRCLSKASYFFQKKMNPALMLRPQTRKLRRNHLQNRSTLPPLRSPTLHRIPLQRRIHKLPEPLALLRILNGGFPLALIGIHQIRHMLLQLLTDTQTVLQHHLLQIRQTALQILHPDRRPLKPIRRAYIEHHHPVDGAEQLFIRQIGGKQIGMAWRSEERRVGKECRSGWRPEH